jgi:hypothetical protein
MINAVAQIGNVTGLAITPEIFRSLEEDSSGMEERKKSRSRERQTFSAKTTLWVAEKCFCIDKRAFSSLVLTLY